VKKDKAKKRKKPKEEKFVMWMGFASLMPIISGWQNHKDRAQGTEHYECFQRTVFPHHL
jgi:hypothetical protein